MGDVTIIRDKNGTPKMHKETNSYVFSKDGVYFKLNKEQMIELKSLISGLLDDSLHQVNA